MPDEEKSQTLFTSIQWWDKRQLVQIENQEILFKHKKKKYPKFYCEGDSALKQVSVVGAIQNSTGHNPSGLLCITLLWAEALV